MAKKKNPEKEPEEWTDPVDDYAEDAVEVDAESEKEPELTAMTGVVGPPGTVYTPGGVVASSGTHGFTGIGTGTWPTYPTIKAPRGGITYPGTPAAATPAPALTNVDSPPRFTKKILVAFIDENEPDDEKNIMWAKNLKLQHGKVIFDEFGNARLELELDLKDVYGNEEA